jgi:hypothetical protein
MQISNFKTNIEELIEQRKAGYKADINLMASNYGTEKETVKEYNGRQLLELLQNADDAQSQQILIKLDTKQKILTIGNKGENCDSFSVEGVKSIMYANLSSKTNNQHIGNKGLGFRSIINWADEISILTDSIELCFSQEIIKKFYKDLTKPEQRKEIQRERNLLDDEIPMAVLAIPEMQEIDNNDWTTIIYIQYKEEFLEDIKNQIKTIKAEVLLFLKHLQSIEIDIDGDIKIIKNPVDKWTIEDDSGEVPNKPLGKNDKNNKYELKIAYNSQLENNGNNYLFAYFPTKIKVDFPFIVHGTFELDSSRNQLTDNHKNEFIIKKLVAFIIKTALNLNQKVNYQALKFLQYEHKNEVLNELGFYEEIDAAIEESEIYPCLDNKYRKKSKIIYSNDFSKFVDTDNYCDLFPYLLISTDNENTINILDNQKLDDFSYYNNKNKDLNLLNKKVSNIDDRVKFIHLLIENGFEGNLPLLTDENGELIDLDDIYTPPTQDILLPDYVHIRFINQELYDKLGEIVEDDLMGKLNKITDIKLFNKTEIFRKIITSTNSELEEENIKPTDLIKLMVNSLYENYSNSVTISDQKIQLLGKKENLQYAKNLYLSKTYPSGKLTEELFGSVFDDSDFLANISIYELGDDKQKIEDFFIWLGVNKYAKLVENKTTSRMSTNDGFRNVTANLTSIKRFDDIQKLPIENIITWLVLDKRIETDILGSYEYYGTKSIVIKNKISPQLKSLFKNHLISSNNKINNLVNDKCIDYGYPLFKSNDIYKENIDSLLLKLGAVDKFDKLSSNKIKTVLESLPKKDPQGKLAQKIYIESFKKYLGDGYDLNNDIALFAKKRGQTSYFSQNEVCYSGSVKLPKEYADTQAIFNYPKKNVSDIATFFGIKDLSQIQTEIKNKKLSEINDEFQIYFRKNKPYILAYRVENLENKNEEAKKLAKLKIELCQNLSCEIDEEKYQLSDYDYLIDGESYLIKIPEYKLEALKQEYDFYTVFGDILGLTFDLENTDKFKNCIKDSEVNIKRDIEEHISSCAINDARDLLGIASDFYNFWHKVYELAGKEYTDNHNNNLELINKELELDIKDSQIKYDVLTNIENAEVVIKIFTKLDIKVENFNNEQTNQIDLSNYHQQKLENCFNDNRYQFKQNLYQYCLEKDKQSCFLTKLNRYQAPKNNHIKLKVNYQSECQKFVSIFGFKLDETKVIDFDKVFDKNKKQLGSNFSYIENNDKIRSLLYFEKQIKKVKDYISKEKKIQKTTKKQVNQSKPKEINKAKLTTPSHNRKNDNHSNFIQGNRQQNDHKKQAGDNAEQVVYETLIEKYGKEKVNWVSKDKPYSDHDFEYKEGDKWWLVEVKTLANDMFYISKNELEFAEKNKDDYRVFLVGDDIDIKEIYPVDFNDKSIFILEEEKMSVRYKLG